MMRHWLEFTIEAHANGKQIGCFVQRYCLPEGNIFKHVHPVDYAPTVPMCERIQCVNGMHYYILFQSHLGESTMVPGEVRTYHTEGWNTVPLD